MIAKAIECWRMDCCGGAVGVQQDCGHGGDLRFGAQVSLDYCFTYKRGAHQNKMVERKSELASSTPPPLLKMQHGCIITSRNRILTSRPPD